jgi:hypothetical protein
MLRLRPWVLARRGAAIPPVVPGARRHPPRRAQLSTAAASPYETRRVLGPHTTLIGVVSALGVGGMLLYSWATESVVQPAAATPGLEGVWRSADGRRLVVKRFPMAVIVESSAPAGSGLDAVYGVLDPEAFGRGHFVLRDADAAEATDPATFSAPIDAAPAAALAEGGGWRMRLGGVEYVRE